MVEERRGDDADGRRDVYVVEDIPPEDAEREGVTPAAGIAGAEGVPAAAAQPAPPEPAAGPSASATGSSASATPATGAPRRGGCFQLLAQSEGLTDAKVGCELPRSGAKVRRNPCFGG